MKKILIIIIVVIIISGCSTESKIEKVSCNDVKELQKQDNTVLIDVRTKEEYEEGHLENAINIPLDTIETSIDNYEEIKKASNLIVYCKSGIRSNEAATILKYI